MYFPEPKKCLRKVYVYITARLVAFFTIRKFMCGGLGLYLRLKLSSPFGTYSLVRVDRVECRV